MASLMENTLSLFGSNSSREHANFSMIYKEDELPVKAPKGPSFMKISLYAICTVGIMLNVMVFWKRKFKSKRQSQTTRTSLQLLSFMAAADTISLAALLLLLCISYFGIRDETLMSIICKVDMFLIHAASAFSIWCWLVLSAVRYIAIFHPYSHLKINQEPVLAVVVIALMCCLLESWILYGTGYISTGGGGYCITLESNVSEYLAQKLHLVEIIWSYFLPFVIITVLDIRISFTGSEFESMMENKCSPNAYSGKTLLSDIYENPIQEATLIEAKKFVEKDHEAVYKNPLWRLFHVMQAVQPSLGRIKPKRSKRRMQQIKVLRRCLCITLLDLSLNLPNYLFRLYLNLLTAEEYQAFNENYHEIFNFVENASQLLYFAQFSLNALYLVYLVYDSPRKRSSGCNTYNVSIYRQASRMDN